MFSKGVQVAPLAVWLVVVAMIGLLIEVVTGASLLSGLVLFLILLGAILWFSKTENRQLSAATKLTVGLSAVCYLATACVMAGIFPAFVKPWLIIGLLAGITVFGWQLQTKSTNDMV